MALIEKKQTYLPFSDALQISLEHIWKRQARSIIVVASSALGISYLTFFLTTNIIIRSSLGSEGTFVEAYHFWLIIVSIFVCCVSLINSTLISVLERYREIGTMKCLGASNGHILKLLLIEALLFGLAGGIVGFTMGMIISILSSYLNLGFNVIQQLPMTELLLLSGPILGLSVLLSVLSTAYPAIRAGKLNPVEALQYDV